MNSWARFTFNLPFSLAVVIGICAWQGIPRLSSSLLLWCLVIALAQILANVFLITAYRFSTFSEASCFTRLEAVFGALLGVLFFEEYPCYLAWVGLCLSFIGVALMNLTRRTAEDDPEETTVLRLVIFSRGSFFAMSTGFLWALACYFIKHACRDLCSVNPEIQHCTFVSTLHILLHLTWMEVLLLTVYLMVADIRQFRHIGKCWQMMLRMGFLSFAASVFWFWAYNITLVSYARAFGNVESLLSVVLSHRVLKEPGVFRQLPGVLTILAGVVLVVLGR
jgi:drug/metabolite transporter (DMT)-like permease